MPVETKPSPPTVDQIANAQITPSDTLGYGNPNILSNRGNDVSVRNDTVKDINIDLIDLSTAIKDYIVNTIKPRVYENGTLIPVPVQFVSPERWVAVQREGFLRDKEGRVLLPMIVIKRDSVVRNRALGNKLDGNKVNLYQSFTTQFSKKNVYDNFAVLTKRIPVKEFHIVPIPDYVIVTFNVSILTNAQDQADDLIQVFNFVADSYWGQPDRFRFKVNIESFTDTVEYSQGEDRSIRSNFNIVMNGYLLPESAVRNLVSQKKFLSKAVIKVSEQIVGEQPDISLTRLQGTDDFLIANGIYLVNSNGNRLKIF